MCPHLGNDNVVIGHGVHKKVSQVAYQFRSQLKIYTFLFNFISEISMAVGIFI